MSSTERLAVCLPLLVLAGPPTLAPGDARGQAPLPPRLSVDPALSPPSGVTRDGRAGLVADWLESHTVRFRKARAARGGRCNPAVWLRAQGTRSWRYSHARALPPGRYVLYTRATIAAGLREASFSARDGNQITFTAR